MQKNVEGILAQQKVKKFGIKKTILQNAKKMRNKGFDIDTIQEITGLTKEEILKLQFCNNIVTKM